MVVFQPPRQFPAARLGGLDDHQRFRLVLDFALPAVNRPDSPDDVHTGREARPDDLFAYDRDEVADPAVVHSGGLHRLYYAARQGTRWQIAMMVSSDRVRWYDIGPVLGPDDEGYDALAVRGPAPFVGADGRVSLYYLASDGVLGSLGLAAP